MRRKAIGGCDWGISLRMRWLLCVVRVGAFCSGGCINGNTAIFLLERADERREFGIAYLACGVFNTKPGSLPLALLGPALIMFAHLEYEDPDLDESIIVKLALDVAVAADRLADNLALNAR